MDLLETRDIRWQSIERMYGGVLFCVRAQEYIMRVSSGPLDVQLVQRAHQVCTWRVFSLACVSEHLVYSWATRVLVPKCILVIGTVCETQYSRDTALYDMLLKCEWLDTMQSYPNVQYVVRCSIA